MMNATYYVTQRQCGPAKVRLFLGRSGNRYLLFQLELLTAKQTRNDDQ